MFARTSLHKDSAAKGVATPGLLPKSSCGYFSTEEEMAQGSPSQGFSWSLRNIAVSPPLKNGQSAPLSGHTSMQPRWPMQAKLETGAVNDPLEQEADHFAERVTRMPEPKAARSPAVLGAVPGLQRKCSCGGSCDECKAEQSDGKDASLRRKPAGLNASAHSSAPSVAPPIVHEVVRSPGKPLDPATRAFFEPRLGRDLGGVRLHTDARAGESANRMDALAYTVGRNVIFAPMQYAPQTQNGRKLLAHELAHVVQQSDATDPGSVVQRKGAKVAGCGFLNLAAAITDIGGFAHIQIQTYLASKGIAPEFPIPRATKTNLGWGCRKLGTPWGYADLAKSSGMGFDLGEIKPVTMAGRVRAKLEVAHYRRRATQSLQRLFKFGTCASRPPGLDDFGFQIARGLTPASPFSLLSGALSGDETIGPFSGDPSLTLKAKEVSPGAICYWCVKGASQQSQPAKPPGPNVGIGVSIGGSTGGAYNAGVGISIQSDSTAYGTAGAGVSYKSDTKAAGAAGAGASVESDSAAAGAAGAGASKDTQSVGAGVAGAGASSGSMGAAAGAAAAGTSEDSATAGAGVAGKGSVKDSAVAGAGASGSGKIEGVQGASTGSPGKPADLKDTQGSGKAGTSKPEAAEGSASAQQAGRQGQAGTTAGQSPTGKGDQTGAGTSLKQGSQAGGSKDGGEKGSDTGGTTEAGSGTGAGPSKDASESAAAKGAQGAKESGPDPGSGTAPGQGGEKDTAGAGGTSKVAGGLGVAPIAGAAASEAERQRAAEEAAKVAVLLNKASDPQKSLFRHLAQTSPDGRYVVPSSEWVDIMMKATEGLNEEEIKYLQSLNWTPAKITAEELRKRVHALLKTKKPPASGEGNKSGSSDKDKSKAQAAKSASGGSGTATGKRSKAQDTGSGKKGARDGPALSDFVTPRKYTGKLTKFDDTGYMIQPDDSQITARTKKGAKPTLEVRWNEGGVVKRAKVEYEVINDPVSYTDGQTKKHMLRFDLRSTNNDPLLMSSDDPQNPTVLPARAPAAYYMVTK